MAGTLVVTRMGSIRGPCRPRASYFELTVYHPILDSLETSCSMGQDPSGICPGISASWPSLSPSTTLLLSFEKVIRENMNHVARLGVFLKVLFCGQ